MRATILQPFAPTASSIAANLHDPGGIGRRVQDRAQRAEAVQPALQATEPRLDRQQPRRQDERDDRVEGHDDACRNGQLPHAPRLGPRRPPRYEGLHSV